MAKTPDPDMKYSPSREWLQNLADGKIICPTHFNWWGWQSSDYYEGTGWKKKQWDQHHRQGQDDGTHEE